MNPVSAVMGALKYMPATLARKALTKVDPRFGKYFANAVSYGLDADRALDYLVDRFQTDSQRDYKRNLEKGAAANTLRPDEQLSRSQMRNAAIPGKLLKGAASLATGGLLGGLGSSEQGIQSEEEMPPEENQTLSKNQAMKEAVLKARMRQEKGTEKESPLGAASLGKQFEGAYGQKANKQELFSSMKELTELLRRMKGGG